MNLKGLLAIIFALVMATSSGTAAYAHCGMCAGDHGSEKKMSSTYSGDYEGHEQGDEWDDDHDHEGHDYE